jgi:FxsC-like protein
MPLFFFSYARLDRDQAGYLDKFYDDLLEEVRQQAGLLTNDEAGFRDTHSIELGEPWPRELLTALGTAKVMVCLYSPTYFQREHCGKEWTLFSERLEAWAEEKKKSESPPLILPILWRPVQAPEHLSSVQWRHPDFSSTYEKKGLHVLTKRAAPEQQDEYRTVLEQLASLIVERAKKYPLKDRTTLPDYDRAANAFLVPTEGTGDEPPPTSTTTGPAHVRFVLVAAKREELKPRRKSVDAYGGTCNDWKPYYPTSPARIGPLLQRLASEGDFTSELLGTEQDIQQRIQDAEKNNSLLFLVVDPWTLRLKPYKDYVALYDKHTSLNCAALVPWNSQDPETTTQLPQLDATLSASFARRLAMGDVMLRTRLETEEALRVELSKALAQAQSRVINYADVVKKAESDQVFVKPEISASGGQPR